MMKKFNKAISLFLSLLMLLCCMSVSSYADHYGTAALMTPEQWDAYLSEASGGYGLCELTPGSNESEMGFSWHAASDAAAPTVFISVNSDMSDAVEFNGTVSAAEAGYSVNRVTATELLPDTTYYYTFGNTEQSVPEAFTTGNGVDYSFLYMGDVHVATSDGEGNSTLNATSLRWSNTLSEILNRNSELDFVLSVGDQASLGLGSEMSAFYAAPALRNISIATIVGNHEKKAYEFGYYGNTPNEYKGVGTSFIGGDYWFRYGDTLFMVIDSTCGSGTDHYNFVDEAVAANEDARWRICTLHHDLYGGAYSGGQEIELMRTYLDPIFTDFDIDLVLQGHSHYYGRTHALRDGKIVEDYTGVSSVTDAAGTIFMVSGSVNRVQYETYPEATPGYVAKNYIVNDILYTKINVNGDALTIETHTLSDDAVVDEFTINKSADDTFDDAENPGVFTVFMGVAGTIYTIVDKILKIFRGIGDALGIEISL